jgi:hypothetical protein
MLQCFKAQKKKLKCKRRIHNKLGRNSMRWGTLKKIQFKRRTIIFR